MGELKKVFRPEFLNRIDEVIVFHKLSRDEIKVIIDLMIGRVRAQVAEHELQLELDRGGQGAAGRQGLGPGDGRPPAAPRDPALHRGPARRRGAAQPATSSPARPCWSSAIPSGDEEDRPLKMKLVKPKKRPPAKKREPVGVGAKSGEGDEGGSAPAHDNGGDTPQEGSGAEPSEGAAAGEATETE